MSCDALYAVCMKLKAKGKWWERGYVANMMSPLPTDYVAIGPRFSNAVLQVLLVLLRKQPPVVSIFFPSSLSLCRQYLQCFAFVLYMQYSPHREEIIAVSLSTSFPPFPSIFPSPSLLASLPLSFSPPLLLLLPPSPSLSPLRHRRFHTDCSSSALRGLMMKFWSSLVSREHLTAVLRYLALPVAQKSWQPSRY